MEAGDWKTLFTNIGSFLSNLLAADESFRQDLVILFSPDNMKELAKTLKQERGYSIFAKLHDELLKLRSRARRVADRRPLRIIFR